MAPRRQIPWAFAALALVSPLALALQVTPNSPCASICQDQADFDVSAPLSSNTKNTDIFCRDALHDGPAGTKWKSCMTCLQESTFSQGNENDQMWFLYNMRYSLAFCLFSYPNATGAGSTPCSTSMACGPLAESVKHGILNQKDMTAFSYCDVGDGSGKDTPTYDRCHSCVSAEGRTEYLANYVIALKAGCLQRPPVGQVIGLNDTVFAPTTITIIDPLSLIKAPEEKGLPGTTIAGIVGGALAFLLILSAILFICYRKRKNRRARAEFEAARHSQARHRHQSSISFQCQTHAMSPRFWPGGEEARSVHEVMADEQRPTQQHPGEKSRRSSLWKPHNSISSYENSLESTSEKGRDSPYYEGFTAPKKGTVVGLSTPLQQISTNVPSAPRNARMSPSSAAVYNSPQDFGTPMSAVSTRSTTALLGGFKPYVPAEHGVHSAQTSPTPPSISAFGSPVSAMTASPLMGRNNGWQAPQQQHKPKSQLNEATTATTGIGIAITTAPPPPPAVPWIKTPAKKTTTKPNTNVGVGAPVESWEVQTAFPVPPPPPKR
ncbi:hypothetical protein OQA88_6422 [Cercophora sp. LCS_1]